MMLPCWAINPEERPEFGDIFVEVSKRYKSALRAEEDVPADPEEDTEYLEPLGSNLRPTRHAAATVRWPTALISEDAK